MWSQKAVLQIQEEEDKRIMDILVLSSYPFDKLAQELKNSFFDKAQGLEVCTPKGVFKVGVGREAEQIGVEFSWQPGIWWLICSIQPNPWRTRWTKPKLFAGGIASLKATVAGVGKVEQAVMRALNPPSVNFMLDL